MCSLVSNSLNAVRTAATTVVQGSYNQVANSVRCCGRHIERLSNENLPESVVKIAKQAINSLPYSVLGVALWKVVPVGISFPLAVGYAVAHTYEKNIFSEGTYKNLWHGLGNAATYFTLKNTANFVQTQTPVFAVATLISLVAAKLCHRHADKIQMSTAPTVDVTTTKS
jgi:hypothetical protein